jgi:membrane protease subunit (stomatin/prohibitin family)
MATQQFITACPRCGKPLKVEMGFWKSNIAKCSCGYSFDVRKEQMDSVKCNNCGNIVVYNRMDMQNAMCPVCRNYLFAGSSPITITCPACNTSFVTDKSAKNHTCPQCKVLVDVQARIHQMENSGKTSLIKWDMGLNDIFLYRHPVELFNIGTQLIVSMGQIAVFIRNGVPVGLFGPGRHTLERKSLPALEDAINYSDEEELTFDSQVYFVRTNSINIPWGVPKILIKAPEMDFYVDFGISGSMDVELIDKENGDCVLTLIERLKDSSAGETVAIGAGVQYNSEHIKNKFKDIINTHLSDIMSNIIYDNDLNILEIDKNKIVIADMIRLHLNEIFDEYGLCVPKNHFNINKIMIHNQQEVDNWKSLDSTRSITLKSNAYKKEMLESERDVIIAQEENAATRLQLQSEAAAGAYSIKKQAKADAYSYKKHLKNELSQEKNDVIKERTDNAVDAVLKYNQGKMDIKKSGGYSYSAETERKIGSKNLTLNINKSGSPKTADNEWICSNCGTSGNTTNFCPNCGNKKPVSESWTCSECGLSGLVTAFCPNCGNKRP